MRAFRFSLLVGGLLTLLGGVVLAGWFRQEAGLVRLLNGAEAMSWSSALGWLLTGLAFLTGPFGLRSGGAAPSRPARVAMVLGGLLILLGLVALAEWAGDLSLGLRLDPLATARWLDDPYPFPGRMRPMSAIGFIAIGAALVLLMRAKPSRWSERLAMLIPLLALGVGMLGVAGSFTPVAALFVGPVLATGLGFLVSGIGLFALHSLRPGESLAGGDDDSQRITLTAGAIVVFTGMVGIVGGFGVLYPELIRELEGRLSLSLKSRTDTLEGGIRQAWQASDDFANQPQHVALMEKVSRRRAPGAGRDQIDHEAAHASELGFSAVQIFDAAGAEIARAGEFVGPELAVPLSLPSPARLLWSNGYLLHTTITMRSGGEVVGYLEAERRLRGMEALHAVDGLGSSVDFPVCAGMGATFSCFPFRSTGGRVLRDRPSTIDGRPLPVSLALAGGRGIVRTTDYRGVQVIAAYAPVGQLGLGADLKIDAAEFYQPVAKRVVPLLILLLLVAAGSIFMVHQQLVPLVRKMRREIDERRKAEARLQQSEARLAEITATLGEGVYVLDGHGAITFVNPEAERLLGWSAFEMIGREAHRLFHGERPDGSVVHEEQCPMHQTFHRGVTYRSGDEWFQCKDGRFVPVSVVSTPIIRDGRPVGAVVSFRDITAQKRIAEELRHHREELEQRVEARTGELRKLNRELEAFSYSVSHDLRAPLRAINGYSGALREDYGHALPPDAHGYLDRVHAATIRMGELVDGLLNLSQVIRSEPDLSAVNLSELAAAIAASLRESEPKRGVEIAITPGIVATGDAALLRVLLENLFINAWKFTARRGEGRIEFGEERLGEERIFYVRDNGVGFDMQFAHRLFQPFERLHRHGEFAGNGIGLATVRRIVERHGGRVWATSGLGEGTTIHFSLGPRA
jgi:PAS domain S-box-containing protein